MTVDFAAQFSWATLIRSSRRFCRRSGFCYLSTSLLERGSYYQSEHGSKSCRFFRVKKVMRKNRPSEALSLGHLLQMCRWWLAIVWDFPAVMDVNPVAFSWILTRYKNLSRKNSSKSHFLLYHLSPFHHVPAKLIRLHPRMISQNGTEGKLQGVFGQGVYLCEGSLCSSRAQLGSHVAVGTNQAMGWTEEVKAMPNHSHPTFVTRGHQITHFGGESNKWEMHS